MNIKIKTKSKIEKIAVTSFLYALGYNYEGYDLSDLLEKGSDLDDYDFPYVLVDVGDYDSIHFCSKGYLIECPAYNWSTEFEKIKVALLKETTFKLSDDYDAVLVDEGIQVGCQFIDFDTFDRFVEFVNSNR